MPVGNSQNLILQKQEKGFREKSGESGSEIAAGLEMDPLLLAALLHGACCLSLLELFLIKKIQR